MKAIGFRCWKDRFAFVVLEGSQARPILVASKLRVAPPGLARYQVLSWFRENVQEVFETFRPGDGAFKVVEATSRTKDLGRAEMEGVLQETAYSHEFGLPIDRRLKSQLRKAIPVGDEPARYVHRVLNDVGLSQLDTERYRDAAVVALSCLPHQ